MTATRVVFADAATDRTLDVLPVADVSYEDYIGKAGAFGGTLPIPDRATAARARVLDAGRCAAYVMRGRDVVWGGPIWAVAPSRDERGRVSLAIGGATWDSYAERRRIRADLAYAGADQLQIARDLWTHMQAAPGGSVGVTYGDELSGVLRDRAYSPYDEQPYAEALATLASVEGGFEWLIRCYRDGAAGRVRRLVLGHPRITVDAPPVVIPSSALLGYSFPSDGASGATTWRSRGASVNQNQAEESLPLLSPEVVAGDLLTAGALRLDGASDYSEVTDAEILAAHARADLAAVRGAVTIPEVTVRLDQMGLVPLGARVRVRIRDVWFDNLDATYRVVGYRVQPAARGQYESATLYLESA